MLSVQRPQCPGELFWEGTVPPGEAEKPFPSGRSWGAWGSAGALPRRWVMAPPQGELAELSRRWLCSVGQMPIHPGAKFQP